MSLALNNIGHLVTNDPSIGNGSLGIINNAGLVADDEGNIVWCGPQDQIDQYIEAQPIDCYGCAVASEHDVGVAVNKARDNRAPVAIYWLCLGVLINLILRTAPHNVAFIVGN